MHTCIKTSLQALTNAVVCIRKKQNKMTLENNFRSNLESNNNSIFIIATKIK